MLCTEKKDLIGMGKAKDMSNQKVGRLTVIERAGSNKRGDALWLCKCDCGNPYIAKGSDLRNGNTKSCGCLHRETASELNYKDIKGQKFNRLIAIEQKGKNEHGSYMWLCQCECGNKITVDGASLRSGHTKSCGCLQKEIASNQMKQFNEEMWQDEEYRENMSRKMSEQNNQWWQDEEYRERMSKQSQEMWQDEEFRNMMTKIAKETMEKLWQDEEYREMQSEKRTIMNYEMWQDEEFRNAHSGENHYWYDPNLTDEDREDKRCQQGYFTWKQQVKELAHHTCDCCGYVGYENDGVMRSHHLNDYHSNKELATDINNGVCLCNHCHTIFHNKHMSSYKVQCTEQDYIEFKQRYLNGEYNNKKE